MITTDILLGGGAGVLLGAAVGAALQRGTYRRGDERDRQRPPWGAVAAAAAALGLVGATSAAHKPVDLDLAPMAVFSVAALAASWIDLDVRRVPNLVTGAGTPAVLIAAAAAGPWSNALRALACAGILLAGFTLLALISSTGAGDVKFAAVIGAALGYEAWLSVLAGVLAGMAVAAVAALVLLARGRSRTSHLPLAPPLAAGALLTLALW